MDYFEAVSPLLCRQIELFKILVYERRLRHRELRNKRKLMREFDTGYIVVVRKQAKLSRRYGISQKLLFKTKGPYRVLEKDTPSSYWLQHLPFCEGLGSLRRKVKEYAKSMENIPSTMVLHKHVDGTETRFATMAGTLANNPLGKCLGVTRRGTHQSAYKDSRWAYEPGSNLCP